MKPLLLFLFLLLAFPSKAANDTLTRAQVYNFSVGDTFDYKTTDQSSSTLAPPSTPWNTSISYSRYITTAIYYSLDSATKYIVRRQELPLPVVFDTLVLDNLSGIEIFLDSIQCEYKAFSFSDTSQYNNRASNTLQLSLCVDPYSPGTRIFAIGIGNVLAVQDGGVHDFLWNNTTELIYFSKSGETWGTPATIAMGVNNITAQQPAITLFPTINNGLFNIKIEDANSANYQLTIYDLTGRAIERSVLKNRTNNIEMNNTSKGMYLWSVMGEGTVLQVGKLIIQ